MGSNQPSLPAASSMAGSVQMFTPISAPVLRMVDPVHVGAILKERERSELEVESKQAEIPSLKPALYTASIDRTLLKNLLFMGKLEAVAPSATIDAITDEQLKEYISSLVHRHSSGYEPAVIEQALASLSMPMHIVDPDARVTHYCYGFFERLDSIGCGDFKTANPKKTLLLLLQKLQPSALRSEMRKRMQYDATLEKDVRRFIKILTMEAKACQTYSMNAMTKKTSSYPTQATSEKVRSKLDRNNSNKSNTTNTSKGEKSQGKSTPPLCFLPKHRDEGVRHYVRNCPSCDEDTKKRLLDELQSKNRGKGGSTKRARDPILPPTNSSFNTPLGGKEEAGVVFSAVFAGKLIETDCADIGADTNLMDSALLDRICAAGGEPNIEPVRKPRKFEMAAHTPDGIKAEIACTRSAVLRTEFKCGANCAVPNEGKDQQKGQHRRTTRALGTRKGCLRRRGVWGKRIKRNGNKKGGSCGRAGNGRTVNSQRERKGKKGERKGGCQGATR